MENSGVFLLELVLECDLVLECKLVLECNLVLEECDLSYAKHC